MRIFDCINPNRSRSYFIVNINDEQKYFHKQTAAWYLVKDKLNLSSDRLKPSMTEK